MLVPSVARGADLVKLTHRGNYMEPSMLNASIADEIVSAKRKTER